MIGTIQRKEEVWDAFLRWRGVCLVTYHQAEERVNLPEIRLAAVSSSIAALDTISYTADDTVHENRLSCVVCENEHYSTLL